MFAIVDVNNFYVSVERVFNLKLKDKPVVVLSNNDGCIIARSNEAKQLGIKMGTPVHEVEKLLKQHKAYIYSSNYPLLGDMSQRVMNTLATLVQEVEVYSIDEAFLDLSGYDYVYEDLYELAQQLRQRVMQWLGIPISVGIAPTKTLAKVANKLAKKGEGVHVLLSEQEIEEALKKTDIEDVWGIGRQYVAMLKTHRIHNAYQLSQARENWVLQQMTVVGHRLYHELRGKSCIPLELVNKPKKAIGSSRSFRRPITSLDKLKEAVATYVSRCAEKLRKQQSCANLIMVFIRTNRFKKNAAQ